MGVRLLRGLEEEGEGYEGEARDQQQNEGRLKRLCNDCMGGTVDVTKDSRSLPFSVDEEISTKIQMDVRCE